MAGDDEAASAAGRLEQALERIEKATNARLRGDHQDQAKVERVAHRLDALIAELRAALAQNRNGDIT
jgi:soluble cytochrome b562